MAGVNAADATVRALARGQLTVAGKALLLVLNWIPLLHLAAISLVLVLPWSWPIRLCAAAAVLYLAPAVFGRLLLWLYAFPDSSISFGSRTFFGWWMMLQAQMIFNRFPLLEEALRIMPGVYSAWLRLWGARVGRLTYWAPGIRILDRSFLDIGDHVIFGAGVRLNSHVIVKKPSGEPELLLASIRIGHRALIGGYSLLTAGTEIAAEEATRACLISPPFSKWSGGKRLRAPDD